MEIHHPLHAAHHDIHYWEKANSYYDIIILPSLSFDKDLLKKIVGVSHYEERLLFNLILLKQKKVHLYYVSSVPLDEDILNYYIDLMPIEMATQDLKERLTLVSANDHSPISLTEKILARPKVIQRLRSSIRKFDKACIACFNPTPLEHTLAKMLRIDILAGDMKKELYYGGKEGSKKTFRKCGIPTSDFTELVFSVKELAQEIVKLIVRNPKANRLVIKLNESFSGEGNAILDICPCDLLTSKSSCEREDYLCEKFESMRFQGNGVVWNDFKLKIPRMGVLAELFVEKCTSSPSCQAIIDFNRKVQIIATHEQVLGGIDGQMYVGCQFPARETYRLKIQEYTQKVGEYLASDGVIGHFGIDFLIGDAIYACEINLRLGGTTHPLMTMRLLTEGIFVENLGVFESNTGKKCYVASDNVVNKDFQGLVPRDLTEFAQNHKLHFCQQKQTGFVFHLLGATSQYGKIGITCIGNSIDEAKRIYSDVMIDLAEWARSE